MTKQGTKQGTNKPKGRKWSRERYVPKRKICSFCSDKVEVIDYKDTSRLRRYISDRGKIEPRRRTGACAKHQRALAVAIKRARHIACCHSSQVICEKWGYWHRVVS